MLGGGFGGYNTSRGLIAFQQFYSGMNWSPILSDLKASPTKIRLCINPTGYSTGDIALDIYFDRAGNNAFYVGLLATAENIIMLDPVAVEDTPSGETIREYTIVTKSS